MSSKWNVSVCGNITPEQRQRIQSFMDRNKIKHFTDGIREYISLLESNLESMTFIDFLKLKLKRDK